jgi:hypothetical protein
LKHLKSLKRLQLLDISLCENIADAGLAHLKGLTELRELNLRGTKVTDTGLRHLRGLTGLRRLDLRHTKVTAAGVRGLQEALPRVQITR